MIYLVFVFWDDIFQIAWFLQQNAEKMLRLDATQQMNTHVFNCAKMHCNFRLIMFGVFVMEISQTILIVLVHITVNYIYEISSSIKSQLYLYIDHFGS